MPRYGVLDYTFKKLYILIFEKLEEEKICFIYDFTPEHFFFFFLVVLFLKVLNYFILFFNFFLFFFKIVDNFSFCAGDFKFLRKEFKFFFRELDCLNLTEMNLVEFYFLKRKRNKNKIFFNLNDDENFYYRRDKKQFNNNKNFQGESFLKKKLKIKLKDDIREIKGDFIYRFLYKGIRVPFFLKKKNVSLFSFNWLSKFFSRGVFKNFLKIFFYKNYKSLKSFFTRPFSIFNFVLYFFYKVCLFIEKIEKNSSYLFLSFIYEKYLIRFIKWVRMNKENELRANLFSEKYNFLRKVFYLNLKNLNEKKDIIFKKFKFYKDLENMEYYCYNDSEELLKFYSHSKNKKLNKHIFMRNFKLFSKKHNRIFNNFLKNNKILLCESVVSLYKGDYLKYCFRLLRLEFFLKFYYNLELPEKYYIGKFLKKRKRRYFFLGVFRVKKFLFKFIDFFSFKGKVGGEFFFFKKKIKFGFIEFNIKGFFELIFYFIEYVFNFLLFFFFLIDELFEIYEDQSYKDDVDNFTEGDLLDEDTIFEVYFGTKDHLNPDTNRTLGFNGFLFEVEDQFEEKSLFVSPFIPISLFKSLRILISYFNLRDKFIYFLKRLFYFIFRFKLYFFFKFFFVFFFYFLFYLYSIILFLFLFFFLFFFNFFLIFFLFIFFFFYFLLCYIYFVFKFLFIDFLFNFNKVVVYFFFWLFLCLKSFFIKKCYLFYFFKNKFIVVSFIFFKFFKKKIFFLKKCLFNFFSFFYKFILYNVFRIFLIYIFFIYFFENVEFIKLSIEFLFHLRITYRTLFFFYVILFYVGLVFFFGPLTRIGQGIWNLRYDFVFVISLVWWFLGLTNTLEFLFVDHWMNVKYNVRPFKSVGEGIDFFKRFYKYYRYDYDIAWSGYSRYNYFGYGKKVVRVQSWLHKYGFYDNFIYMYLKENANLKLDQFYLSEFFKGYSMNYNKSVYFGMYLMDLKLDQWGPFNAEINDFISLHRRNWKFRMLQHVVQFRSNSANTKANLDTYLFFSKFIVPEYGFVGSKYWGGDFDLLQRDYTFYRKSHIKWLGGIGSTTTF